MALTKSQNMYLVFQTKRNLFDHKSCDDLLQNTFCFILQNIMGYHIPKLLFNKIICVLLMEKLIRK